MNPEIYFFPDTDYGREIMARNAEGLRACGREVEEGEETVTCRLLKLTVTNKRPGEGKIAEAMKK